MKKSTRRTMMMSSLAMLIVAVLALGTATYAWFTTSNQGSVQNIQFNATSAGGIEFSTNGTTWKSDLDFDTDFNQTVKTFSPISAHSVLVNNSFALYDGYIPNSEDTNGYAEQAGNIVITGAASTNNYYELVFYVRNSADAPITVSLNNASITDTVTASSGDLIPTSTATRLGFILSNPVANGTAVEEIGTTAANSMIVQPENGYDTSYYGIYDVTTPAVLAPDSTYSHIAATGQTGVASSATTTYHASDVSFEIPAQSFVRVRLFVWLEGQDVDCDNSLGSGNVAINLFFEKN